METAIRRSSNSSSSPSTMQQVIIVQIQWVQTLYDEETRSLIKKASCRFLKLTLGHLSEQGRFSLLFHHMLLVVCYRLNFVLFRWY